MNDFNKPIRPVKREEKNKPKVEFITDIFEENDDLLADKNKTDNKQNFLLTYLSIIKKFLNIFTKEKNNPATFLNENELINDLSHLKELLVAIKEENPTENLLFAKELAKAWNKICEQNIKYSSYKLHQLIVAFNEYPSKEDHSLGFYLTRYSGETWFPLPFFDLIKMLHNECFTKKKNSDLDRWISLISEILEETKKD